MTPRWVGPRPASPLLRFRTAALFAAMLCVTSPPAARAEEAPEFDVAIRNVTILPCHTDTVWAGRVLLVRDGRIARIAEEGSIAWKALQVVDGTGKFLIPGLSDMHVHLPAQDLERAFRLNLSAGVLYVRSMRGRLDHIALRDSLERSSALAPQLFLSAPPILASHTYGNIDSLVGAWKAMGFDQVKILTATPAQLSEFGAACRRHDMSLGGHQVAGLRETLQAGYASIEHLGRYVVALEEGALEDAVRATVAAGLYHCPTLDWYNLGNLQATKAQLHARSGMEFVGAETLSRWDAELDQALAEIEALSPEDRARARAGGRTEIERRLAVVKSLHDHGANLLVSPDATAAFGVAGYSILEEMKLFQGAGVPNMAILRYATIVPARFRGDAHLTGSLEEGKRADMVLLDANPVEDLDAIGSVEGIFLRGKWHRREDLIRGL